MQLANPMEHNPATAQEANNQLIKESHIVLTEPKGSLP
jgi:hypothetical protein